MNKFVGQDKVGRSLTSYHHGKTDSGKMDLIYCQLKQSTAHWQRIAHGSKPAGAQRAFGHCSQTQGLVLGAAVWSRELDSVVVMSSFQLTVICDSTTA